MRWAERIERGRRKSTNAIALVVALLAFAVRFYWTMVVQHPLTALYSDMGGYYGRALDFLDGKTHGDPRVYAFFPWGTHVLMGLELAVVGRTSHIGLAVLQSILGTIPAVCVVFFTDRVVRSRFWVIAAGVVAALWQPSIVHSGFFMSELWFSATLVPGTLFFLRVLEGKSGAFRAGSFLALAIVVRPQVLLTIAIVGSVLVLVTLWRRLTTSVRAPYGARDWGRFLLPIVAMLAVSAVRFHHLTGHWGLVSENGAINRVFGATHIGRVEATWNQGSGRFGAWYTPPAKTPVRPEDAVVFEGYIGDAELLDKIREEHVKRETPWQRVVRMHRNIKLLIYRTTFPEDDFAHNGQRPFRATFQWVFRVIVVNLTPVAFFGICAMLLTQRQRSSGIVFLAHGVTLVVVAALYFAEARMRMPYDPFLLTGAAAGAATVLSIFNRARQAIFERRHPIIS